MKTTPALKSNAVNYLLVTIFLFISVSFFPDYTFAQGRDAGGQADGVIIEPCAVSFKRNNGNGWGVCGGDSQIRVHYSELPSVAPQLTQIIYENTNTGEQTSITNVMLPVDGNFVSKTQPYISYCLNGSMPPKNNGNPPGNIPPAVKLVLVFTYPSGQVCRLDIEE